MAGLDAVEHAGRQLELEVVGHRVAGAGKEVAAAVAIEPYIGVAIGWGEGGVYSEATEGQGAWRSV